MNQPKVSGILYRMGIKTWEQFADMVYTARLQWGFTYDDMGEYVGGISAATVYRWEKKHVCPKSRIVIGKLIDKKIIHYL